MVHYQLLSPQIQVSTVMKIIPMYNSERVERTRKKGSARGRKREGGPRELCAMRLFRETRRICDRFRRISTARAGISPGLTHFFVEYYLCTPSGCKYSCGTRMHICRAPRRIEINTRPAEAEISFPRDARPPRSFNPFPPDGPSPMFYSRLRYFSTACSRNSHLSAFAVGRPSIFNGLVTKGRKN